MPEGRGAYDLCALCIERQGAPGGTFNEVKARKCFLCRGTTDRVRAMAKKAVVASKKFEFKSFSVGVTLPEGVQEREDEVRSDLKLRGSETVKTQAARMVSAVVARETGKSLDRGSPEAFVLADFGRGKATVSTRPLFYYARYAKPSGVPQRREPCRRCSGDGCTRCRKTGFERTPSVESGLRKKLREYTGSRRMALTWMGSEDGESRVYPPGRPFIAEVKSPVKREVPGSFVCKSKKGVVRVASGRVLRGKPSRLPRFRFTTRIVGVTSAKVGKEAVGMLGSAFRRTAVRFERPHDAPVTKTVYSAAGRARGRSLVVEAELDGGLPVKRFVTGEAVSPSVAEVLGTGVVVKRFDIMKVTEVGRLGYQ